MDTAKALRELRRGTAEYCVLALLTQRPMYGFELVRTLEQTGGLVTSLGTIYPLLARLRADELVITTMRISEGGPARKYYEITPHGSRILDDFIGEWRRFSEAVNTLFGVSGKEKS